MRVFVAGATGAMGIPLVKRLVSQGHKVFGMTRHESKAEALRALGAEPVVCDVLDQTRLQTALLKASPEVVFHALTALPENGPVRAADLHATNLLRTQGTSNLLQASIVAGVKKLVAESIILVYGYGDHGPNLLQESQPVKPPADFPAWMQPTLSAGLALEEQIMKASREGRIEGVVLRFGFIYGPEAGSTRYAAKMLRKRMMPLFGGGEAVTSWIHTEDAAAAFVAAMERGRGGEIYNIVDDEPVSWKAYMTRLAEISGAHRPVSMPLWVAKLAAPYAAQTLTSVFRVSNAKAKAELGWSPRYPTYHEGLETLRVSPAAV
jgi:nucleoside-diphosphate-sugar epimerase